MNTECVALELERNALRSTLRAVLARAVSAEARLAAVEGRAGFESTALNESYRRGFNNAMGQVRAALAAPSPQAEPARCVHGRTKAHDVYYEFGDGSSSVGCPGPQSTEETQ